MAPLKMSPMPLRKPNHARLNTQPAVRRFKLLVLWRVRGIVNYFDPSA